MIDLSHLNAAGFRDVAAISDASAGGDAFQCACDQPACAQSGGLAAGGDPRERRHGGAELCHRVFAAGWAVRADTPIELMVRHVDALVEALGEDGVALGSDFDGAMMPAAIGDVTGVPKLLQALLDKGYGEALVGKIALGNWVSDGREGDGVGPLRARPPRARA